MTSPATITARSALFGGAVREVVEGDLAERLRTSGVEELALRRAPVVAAGLRSAAVCQVAKAVDGLLEIDLGGVAVAGWRRYERLRGAAMRTRTGGVERVELYAHEVTRTCCPRLEVVVGENQVGEFSLELDVAVRVQPLAAIVRNGMLVALGPGDCTVTVSLGAPEVGPIMRRERVFKVANVVDLRRPIPLLPNQPAPPPTSPSGAFPRPVPHR
ncbi:hypothetical protein [Nocardia bhagyanarayanae]|uniref:Uncharacterized protein n=1 Tax=Nocardia bhagyanarayanae TaxID=1215925 RepID=A0A543FID3_9NOCA|nr:hypothetical protein [Nocardia bhagyanarayanae]TQM33620.1 hypothetical protein FB390_5356 [Nocardia bhagyanarayanae]